MLRHATPKMADQATCKMADKHNQLHSSAKSSFVDDIHKNLQLKADCTILENLCQDKQRLKWTGDLISLKNFFNEILGLHGKWTSPGGNSKRFNCSNYDFTVTWYCKKQLTLLFQGRNGECLKQKLIAYVGETKVNNQSVQSPCGQPSSPSLFSSDDDAVENSTEMVGGTIDRIKSFEKCACSCRSLGVDVEGVKLDITILQREMKVVSSQLLNNEDCGDINMKDALFRAKERSKQLENDMCVIVKERNFEVDKLNQTICSLNDEIRTIEEERDALRLALNLITDEKQVIDLNNSGNLMPDQTEAPPVDKSQKTYKNY